MRFPVLIELHRSYRLSLLLVLFHIAASASIFVLPWPLFPRTVALALVALSAWRSLRPSEVVNLCLSGKDRLECTLKDGTHCEPAVLPETTVFAALIVLRLRFGEGKRTNSLALLPDHMSADQFRVLRLWLRWHAVSTIEAKWN
ncbi:protein YgfX [Propionivibrio sp.]|uniref:protein YgfX n=1 Tax=Propionivibrio sp. TaxID=2212460 RepID=UPI003421EB8D|nr:hypothetical protein [Propionivibrio sp.]